MFECLSCQQVPARKSDCTRRFPARGRDGGFRVVLILSLMIALAGCGDKDGEGIHGGANACHRAVVTSGLGLRWAYANHRISLWNVHPVQDACPEAVPGDGMLSVGSIGGPWSTGQVAMDKPSVSYDYFAVDSDVAAFAVVSVPITIDAPSPTGTASVALLLPEHGMEGYEQYTALLSGLALTTNVQQVDPLYPDAYDPSYGYTSRGIGAGVTDPVLEGDVVRFSVWAHFEHGSADRPDMNQALEHARTRVVVHILLVGLRGGAVTPATKAYLLEYPPPRLLFAKEYDHAPEELRRTEIAGVPGLAVAAVGITNFDFRLFGSVPQGEYMREFYISARMLSHDPVTGRAVLDVDGFASNVGIITYETMENDFSAGLVLLQLPAGTAVPGRIHEAFETGETFLPLNP